MDSDAADSDPNMEGNGGGGGALAVAAGDSGTSSYPLYPYVSAHILPHILKLEDAGFLTQITLR